MPDQGRAEHSRRSVLRSAAEVTAIIGSMLVLVMGLGLWLGPIGIFVGLATWVVAINVASEAFDA